MTCDEAVLKVLRTGKRLSGPQILEALSGRDCLSVESACMRLLGEGRINLSRDWEFFLGRWTAPCCGVTMEQGEGIWSCEICGTEICTPCSSDDEDRISCRDVCVPRDAQKA